MQSMITGNKMLKPAAVVNVEDIKVLVTFAEQRQVLSNLQREKIKNWGINSIFQILCARELIPTPTYELITKGGSIINSVTE